MKASSLRGKEILQKKSEFTSLLKIEVMNTFRKIQLFILFFSSVIIGHAQVSVGIKAGANFADTRVAGSFENLVPEQTTYTGCTAGIVAEIPVSGNFSFRPELNYIQKGFIVGKSYDLNLLGIDMNVGAKAKTRINYMELPLLFKYNIGNQNAKAYIIAGPNVAYATSANLRPVATFLVDFNLPLVKIDLTNDIYQRWELSGTMGAGGEVKAGNGKIFADARYNLGFTNMLNNPIVDVRIKNQGFNVSAGYAFNF